jgi:hypothetical protein
MVPALQLVSEIHNFFIKYCNPYIAESAVMLWGTIPMPTPGAPVADHSR